MKKLIFIPLMALVCLLVSCGGKGEELVFDHFSVSKEALLDRTNQSAPHCSVELEMDSLSGQYGQVASVVNATIASRIFYMEALGLEQAADSFASKYCRDYVKNYAPLYREDKADQEKRAWYEYRYKLSTSHRQERSGAVCYLIDREYYEGGAHGLTQQLAMNFDTKTGNLLTLQDIFVPGFEQRLNEQLLQELLDHTNTHNLDELHEQGYLYSMDMFAAENFIWGDDEVTFIYNPYEIADYSKGRILLTIDLDDVKDIVR